MIRYVLAWIPMLLIAIVNGALRQLVFAKEMPELRAHQLSTAIGSVLIGLFIWIVIRIWPPHSARQALSIGFMWLAFTVVFEFFLVDSLCTTHGHSFLTTSTCWKAGCGQYSLFGLLSRHVCFTALAATDLNLDAAQSFLN